MAVQGLQTSTDVVVVPLLLTLTRFLFIGYRSIVTLSWIFSNIRVKTRMASFKLVNGDKFDSIKGPLSCLRQFLATKASLKLMKNNFFVTLKSLFVLKICKFLSWLFGHLRKRFDYWDQVNFKIYDATTWKTNNCNAHIGQYLKK